MDDSAIHARSIAAGMPIEYADLPHERTDLEALLPDELAGLPLLKSSVDGDFAIGDEGLYTGVFSDVVDELVPDERRSGDAFFAEQLQRLWLATGYFMTPSGDPCSLTLYRVDDAPAGLWESVLARRGSSGWAEGLGGNRLRAFAFERDGDLLELMLRGPGDLDAQLVDELRA